MAFISSGGKRLAIVAIIFQLFLLILFAILGEYGEGAAPSKVDHPQYLTGERYAMFQDVHVMIFVGFGFLMTFLAKYGFSAVGYNFLISALAIQWAIIINSVMHFGLDHGDHGDHDDPNVTAAPAAPAAAKTVAITLENLLLADFATAAVLISFGAVLGKTSALQLLVMAIIEIVIFHGNEIIGRKFFHAVDAGDSIFVHAFGAYFGLAVARVLYKPAHHENAKETSVYHSDLFAMIGSLFLWIFWPSFNSGGLSGVDRHRAVVNTYLALASCCVTAFAVSALVEKKGKFNMVHIQNSTLAGGVAVGAIGNFMIQPWGAALVGIVAAVVSVLGYEYLTPLLSSRLGIHDTCGVHNLHGMPAVIAAVGSVIASAVATKEVYMESLASVFELEEKDVAGFSAGKQAGNQLAALGVTLALAIVGGAVTGLIMRIPIWGNQEDLYDDGEAWILEEEEDEHKHEPLQTLQSQSA